MRDHNQNIEYLSDTNCCNEPQNSKKEEKILVIWLIALSILIVTMFFLSFCEIAGLKEYTAQIKHYNYHAFGCCEIYD